MSSAVVPEPLSDHYHERLTPTWWLWSAPVGLGLGLGLILVPLGLGLAATVFALSSLVFVALLARSTPTIGVLGSSVPGPSAAGSTGAGVPDVVAGKAHIPVSLVGTVDVLDAEGMRHAHGPGLDARAYLCLRGWVHSGVRIHLVDPEDPTPYWLVSSRRPQAFADAVAAAGAAARSGRSAPDGAGPVSTSEPQP